MKVVAKKKERRKDKRALNYFIIGAVITASVLGIYFLRGKSSGDGNLTPADSFEDLHGLAVRPDGDLYVATHYGLYLLKNDTDLYRIGNVEDDLMGFSTHPKDPNKVYASGHPPEGGDLGVMVSEDGGVSWRQIFRGLEGEAVDFHAMALSPADPNILYGWHGGKLYVTRDGGKTWKFASAQGLTNVIELAGGTKVLQKADVTSLVADAKMPQRIYAGTYNGLYLSSDMGETWHRISDVGFVGGVAPDPKGGDVIYAFTERYGMAKSQNGGATWLSIGNGISIRPPEAVLYLAVHPLESEVIYAGTTAGKIFKSESGGSTWRRVR